MLKEKLTNDLKQAMKSADQETVGVLRILLTAIKNKEIEKKTKSGGDGQLNEEEVIQALSSDAKKHKESIEIFTKGSRKDLADKEEKELAIVQKYLPKQLGEAEIEQVVDKILQQTSGKDFGSVMKEAMKELKGKADGKVVSEIIQRKLK
ncbi:MAG: GatB/YqeY domain-containing protein [Patescibacteria group bacterium]